MFCYIQSHPTCESFSYLMFFMLASRSSFSRFCLRIKSDVRAKRRSAGQIFDAWTEFFKKENWDNAMAKHGLDIDFYTYRDRSVDEILPWDFIDIGVTRKFLEREWENAQNEKVTPNCRQQCSGCGAARFGGGVCFENKN